MTSLSSKVITGSVLGIIILIVLFQAYASIVPTAQTAGTSLGDTARCQAAGGNYCSNLTSPYCYNFANCSAAATTVSYNQIPLSSIFGSSGVIFVIIMAFLLIVVIGAFMMKGKK